MPVILLVTVQEVAQREAHAETDEPSPSKTEHSTGREASASSPAVKRRPPRLIQFVEAPSPQSALEARRECEVVLTEVYQGFVPVRIGADALGGAAALVTSDNLHGTVGSVSYLSGAFNTHRLDVSARDSLEADRDLLNLVSKLKHGVILFNERLKSIFFLKSSIQHLHSEEPLPGGRFREINRTTTRFGIGNAFRYPWQNLTDEPAFDTFGV